MWFYCFIRFYTVLHDYIFINILLFHSNFSDHMKCYYRFFPHTSLSICLQSIRYLILRRILLLTRKSYYRQTYITDYNAHLIIKRTIYEGLVANKFCNIYEVTRSSIIMGSSTKNIVGTCYKLTRDKNLFFLLLLILWPATSSARVSSRRGTMFLVN